MPALVPVNWNLTGTVLPNLKTELPSAFTGWSTPDHAAVTVTVKVSVPRLPALSVAVQVTVVVPSGKTLPDALSQPAATAPSTRSEAVGAAYVTAAPAADVATADLFGDTVRFGAVVSCTVTLK